MESKAKNQGGLEDPKTLAKTMLQEGADIEAIMAETNLSKPTILGLKGALVKAQKRLAATENAASVEEETDLNTDLKKETQTTLQAVALARSQQRLKSLDPKSEFLHGPGQSETSPGKLLTDIEFARYLRSLREQETTGHQNNGDSQATLGLQKQIDDLKQELHRKDIEALKSQTEKLAGEIGELRADLRHSTNSGSDLAVCVKSVENLLSEGLAHPGPIRLYLTPTEQLIRDKKDAPALLHTQVETGRGGVVSELSKHGLVTQVLRKGS